MALLDFMKAGFNNSVGHLNDMRDSIANQPQMYDPHANARRLMGGAVQEQQAGGTGFNFFGGNNTSAQDNLLDAPQEIVVNPAMQNRQTFTPNKEQVQPDMSAVHQYNNFDFESTPNTDYYNKAANDLTRTYEDKAGGIRLSEGGYKEEAKEEPSFVNQLNAPLYESYLMGKPQDMSLQNAPDQNVPTVTTPTNLNYINTPYEANQEIEDLNPDSRINFVPNTKSNYPNTEPVSIAEQRFNESQAKIRARQAESIEKIMNNPKTSTAQKKAILEKYNLDPSTYLIPKPFVNAGLLGK